MKTIIISIHHEDAEKVAIDALVRGEVIAIPTDTVYGIACLIDNIDAISLLYSIKDRVNTKAIPILIGEYDQINSVSEGLTKSAQILAQHFWPGPLTLVVKRKPHLPDVLSPYSTIGVRIPAHPWLCNLIMRHSPLATTSANISGFPTTTSAEEVFQQLDGRISLIIDGGRCASNIPSTIVDCSKEEIEILREGVIKKSEILNILDNY